MKTIIPIIAVVLLSGCSSLPYVTRNEVEFGPFISRTHKNIILNDLDVSYTDPKTGIVTKVKAGSYTAMADPNAASVAMEEAKLKAQMFTASSETTNKLIEALLKQSGNPTAPAQATSSTPSTTTTEVPTK